VIDADGRWHSLPDEEVPYSGRIHDIAGAPDGTVYLATEGGVVAVDDADWSNIGGPGQVTAITVDPQTGYLWGVGYGEAGVYDGESWEIHSSDVLGEGDYVDLGRDVAADPEGRLWVTTASTVAMFDGWGWIWWGPGRGFPETDHRLSLESIALDAAGTVWVAHDNGMLSFDGADWHEADVPDGLSHGSFGKMSSSSDGRVFVPTNWDGLGVYDGSWAMLTHDDGLFSEYVRSAFMDGRERLWVGTTWGVAVRDAGDWTVYTQATSELAGDCVESILVVGRGPDLIEPSEPRVGHVIGRVVSTGEPAVDSEVLLCSDSPPPFYSGAHPCDGFAFSLLTATEEDGVYRFPDVPVASYHTVLRIDEHTSWRTGPSVVVHEGETAEIPVIDLAGG
jgi:ligand-binding sensor domain-containing protein